MPEASTATPRKRRLSGWLIAAILALLAVAGSAAVLRPWEVKPVVLKMETVSSGPVVLAVNGRVAALRSVVVRPTVQARLASVTVDIGDTVTASQLIAQLGDSEPRSQVEQAAAALETGRFAAIRRGSTLSERAHLRTTLPAPPSTMPRQSLTRLARKYHVSRLF